MNKVKILDTSLVVPYVSAIIGNKAQRRDAHNRLAKSYIEKLDREPLKISVATYAEAMRHFHCEEAAAVILEETFDAPIPMSKEHGRRWARLQNRARRTMGDNDAWIAAQAVVEHFNVVGHDDEAYADRPDLDYLNFAQT